MPETPKMPDYGVITIGTGPAGFTASIYASRYGIRNLVIGQLLGGQAGEAHKICNFPGFPEVKGPELMQKFYEHAQKMGAEVVFDIVTQISGQIGNFTITTQSGKTYTSQVVILAHGARHRKLEVPREDEFLGKGLAYCATCDGPLYRDKAVAVVGGSDAANTASLYLSEIASKVYQIYRKDKLRGDQTWVQLVTNNPKIEILYNSNITELIGTEKLQAVKLDQPHNGNDTLQIDGLFVEIGTIPDPTLAKSLNISLDDSGYIIVGPSQATSIPGIYAAGDVTTGSNGFRQIVTATAEGAIAAESAFKQIEELKKPTA